MMTPLDRMPIGPCYKCSSFCILVMRLCARPYTQPASDKHLVCGRKGLHLWVCDVAKCILMAFWAVVKALQ